MGMLLMQSTRRNTEKFGETQKRLLLNEIRWERVYRIPIPGASASLGAPDVDVGEEIYAGGG